MLFQVNDGKSTPIIGIDYATSDETASHLGSFLTILEIRATLSQKHTQKRGRGKSEHGKF